MLGHETMQMATARRREDNGLAQESFVMDEIEKMFEGARIRRPINRRPDYQQIGSLNRFDQPFRFGGELVRRQSGEEMRGGIHEFDQLWDDAASRLDTVQDRLHKRSCSRRTRNASRNADDRRFGHKQLPPSRTRCATVILLLAIMSIDLVETRSRMRVNRLPASSSFSGSALKPFGFRPATLCIPSAAALDHPLAKGGLEEKPWDIQNMIRPPKSGGPGTRVEARSQTSVEGPTGLGHQFLA